MKILFGIIILFSLFGPKIGIFDTSILVVGTLAVPVLLSAKQLKVPIPGLVLVSWSILILGYSILIIAVMGATNDYAILRAGRVLLTTIILVLIIYNVPVAIESMLNIIIGVLLLNPLAIFLQILVPATMPIFADIFLFNKGFVVLRAFGLTAGYDTAAFFCVMGMILSGVTALQGNKSTRYVILALVFVLASTFTSRSGMTLGVVTFAGFSAYMIGRGRLNQKVMGTGFIFVIGLFLMYYMLPLLSNTLMNLNLPVVDRLGLQYVESFARTDIEQWALTDWVLPSDDVTLLFGSGMDPSWSDVGYIKIVFMLGVVGFGIIVGPYLFMWRTATRVARQYGQGHVAQVVGLALAILIPMQFVFNVKNLYFLTRGFYDLLLILFMMIIISTRKTSKLAVLKPVSVVGSNLTQGDLE